ncbi:hypothetical protein BC940DRAFT_329080 [Gongronella butleri]|nr:hypothetical protein BC940DRAFT_329080 [Gongronella butleri]
MTSKIVWGFMLENTYFMEFDPVNQVILESAFQEKKNKQASHFITIRDSHLPSAARVYFGVVQIHLRMPGTRYYVKRRIVVTQHVQKTRHSLSIGFVSPSSSSSTRSIGGKARRSSVGAHRRQSESSSLPASPLGNAVSLSTSLSSSLSSMSSPSTSTSTPTTPTTTPAAIALPAAPDHYQQCVPMTPHPDLWAACMVPPHQHLQQHQVHQSQPSASRQAHMPSPPPQQPPYFNDFPQQLDPAHQQWKQSQWHPHQQLHQHTQQSQWFPQQPLQPHHHHAAALVDAWNLSWLDSLCAPSSTPLPLSAAASMHQALMIPWSTSPPPSVLNTAGYPKSS